jgi:hypothetical protein
VAIGREGFVVTPSIDKAAFAVLARRSGVPLTDEDIATLYEGYYWFEQLVADLDRPADAAAEPALVFRPETAS